MMTLRKLPTARPSTRQVPTNTAGEDASSSITGMMYRLSNENAARSAALSNPRGEVRSSDHRAELEDRQVHGDHQAPHEHAQDRHDQGLEQARHGVDRIVDLRLVERRDLGRHVVQ